MGIRMELFKIEHLDFTYPGEIKKALNDISFSVRAGEIITLCGSSGCGKSTLLRHLKSVLSPFGWRNGAVYFKGKQIGELDAREETEKIGFVSQSADNQIVTDKVYHELAFGLESLAYDNEKIRQRVAEMASFFGIQDWFYKNVSELSGGQKQILSLASIMTMLPEVLVLDEPTSQLDPIAALEFVNMLIKINRELGVTIIVTEHRLDEIIPYSDRVIVMEEGKIIADDNPVNVCLKLKEEGHAMLLSMPISMRIWNGVRDGEGTCPLTVNEGRIWLEDFAARYKIQWETEQRMSQKTITCSQERVIELKEIWFKYGKGERDILKGVNMGVNKGEIFGILGGNGTGKSTLLSVMSGIRKPYRGKVITRDKVGMLTQNPKNLFVKKTVEEDLREVCRAKQEERLEEVIRLCRLDKLLRHNPYDLSGGEQQRAAMAKVLLTEPDILLLDEPTKGMDNEYKQELGQMLMNMAQTGTTIIMVSHDIEFCAEWTDRCALFFDGSIISERETREFFINNSFYTTTANRMARNVLPTAVTPKDVIDACNGSGKIDIGRGKTDEKNVSSGGFQNHREDSVLTRSGNDKRYPDIKIEGEKTGVKRDKNIKNAAAEKPDKRFLTAAIMIFIAIPFTIFSGIYFFDDQKYLFISLVVMLECIVPFFILYEGKNPGAREVVMISVLCAIGVAGRMAFYMFPQFKPIMALVIISGVSLGAETGFLIGAITMLVSNIMFEQGPWTPWQMFAMGIVGFFAGVLFHRKTRRFCYERIYAKVILCIYGIFAAIILYGGIMNPAAAIMAHAKLNRATLLSYYGTGLPMDLVHGIATVLFLLLLTQPIMDKIERVKGKYGLMDK